jgi:CHASE3 domain sensor protein
MFPFLAVMMCMMGALIILLIVITSNSRSRAVQEALAAREALEQVQEKPTPDTAPIPPTPKKPEEPQPVKTEQKPKVSKEKLKQEIELMEARLTQLKTFYDKNQTELKNERDKLSHIETHMRKIRDQIYELEKANKELEELENASKEHQVVSKDRIDELKKMIEERKKSLDEEMKKAEGKGTSYAVVPYKGKNSTKRRPIYLECRSDAIVLQPEGISFVIDDFQMYGLGNPLADTLRAISQVMLRKNLAGDTEEGSPYPLMLIRPDGIGAYYTARRAVSSWGNDFGYEFIDQDWELKFGIPDLEIAQVAQATLKEARERQKRNLLYNKELAKRNGVTEYRVTKNGLVPSTPSLRPNRAQNKPDFNSAISENKRNSLIPGGNRPSSSRSQSGFGISDRYNAQNSGSGGYNKNSTTGQPAGGPNGLSVGNRSPYGGSNHSNRYAERGSYSGSGNGPSGVYNGSSQGGAYSNLESGFSNEGLGSQNLPYGALTGETSGSGSAGSQTNGSPGSAQPSGARSSSQSYANQFNRPSSASGGAGGSSERGGASGPSFSAQAAQAAQNYSRPMKQDPNAPGIAVATDEKPKPRPVFDSRTGTLSSSSGSRPGELSPRSPDRPLPDVTDPNVINGPPQEITAMTVDSIAKVAGKDWAIPSRQAGSIGIRKPIYVDMNLNKMVLQRKNKAGKDIPFNQPMQGVAQELVNNVWAEVQSWGIAGRQMYWRPTLFVRVQPGGEQRFEQMKQLLENSGLGIERIDRVSNRTR